MKQFYRLLLFVFMGLFATANAQVSLTATNGTLTGTYTTLKGAFDAINAGTHKGDIVIEISANTNEGVTPATLLSGDADPTSYSSVYIYPTADGVSISGNPASGFGVVQLNGADNVVIDGDNPNTSGTNRNLSIVNTAATATGFTSCLRVATLAGASAHADNIFLFNLNFTGNVTAGNASGITATTSSSNTSFGLYFGGKGSSTTTLSAITSETADAALNGTTMNNIVIDNIAVNQCARGIAFNGAVASVCSSLSITNSVIGATAAITGYPVTTPSSTVYTKGIWVAGVDGAFIGSNTIQNIMSYVGTTVTGIELSSNIGTGSTTITGNTINGVLNNSTGGTANGILVSAAGSRFSISGNTVSNVQASLANSTSPTVGINVATSSVNIDVQKNKVSKIYNNNTGGYGAAGIQLSTAANGCEISNNFVYDVMNIGASSFSTTTENATGILISSGSSHKIYNNTVNLSGTSNAASSNMISCFTVGSSASSALDIRNNLFSNTVILSGAPTNNAHVCMYFPFTAASANSYIINNNAYYTGSVAGLSGVAFAGSNSYVAANLFDAANFNPFSSGPATNFRSWSSVAGLDNNDIASFASTAAAPFVSATDLHITGGATRLESGGTGVGVNDDIDGAVRGTFPDIGADEFTGTLLDQNPPLMTYTPLSGTCTLGNRTLTVTIKDPSGVPTSGLGLPVLYWKINAGAYAAATATSLGGGNYSFTFGAGAVVNDIVSYYIVAQDAAGTPNVISAPSIGAGGFTASAPAASTPPTTPESYQVQNNLAPGTYTVGGAGVYTTLTAAINAYNNSCLSGAVIFELIDATYSTSETFPISIGNPVASATNTLTIRPAAGVNATITGASTSAIIKLNGADYVTIDGSNNGTASQNLTITNTDPGTSTAVVWVASPTSTNGATHNTIKNIIILGSGTTNTYAGVVSCNGTSISNTSTAIAANSFNSYQNLTIKTAFRGIALLGVSTGDNNDTISQCKIGSSTAAEKIGFRGIYVSNQTNVNINNNTIFGITSTVGSNSDVAAGISVRGAISNGIIHTNNISDCKNTSTSGWTVHGITLQSTTANTGMSIYNNFIYDIAGFGWNPNLTDNGHGIGILSGGGYKIYYNSISLTTNQTVGNTAAIFIDNRPATTGPTPGSLDIRNNIFSNEQTTNVRYSIYSAAPASSFTNINYNDYYTTGSTLGFLGSARANLAAWVTATGADGNSVSVIPQYTSTTNLHLLGSSTLNNIGTPLAGFVTDIDGAIRSATTPDIGADEFTPPNCGGVITGGTISASKTTLCVSETVVFNSTGFSFGNGMTYQWESSPDNITWSPIAGETNPVASSITISTGAYYRLSATCTLTATTGTSNVIQITVNTPSVVSSTGGSVCGLGTVSLSATGSSGTTLRWYDVSTGGAPLGTGSPFVTPSISTTTNYYVEAVAGLSNATVGPVSPTAQGGVIQTAWTTSWEHYFDVIQSTQLISVDIFPWASGETSTINVYNSAGTIIGSQTYTTSVSGGATAQTITFSTPVTLTPGTGYYIYSPTLPTSGLTRNNTGSTYPYTSSAINLVGNDLGAGYYMYYYNIQYVAGCASPRTTVVATVSAPPGFTHPTSNVYSICGTGSANLNATDADYSSYSWSPSASLSNATISNPVATPTATTTYTVTVSNGVCSTSDTITILVQPTPSALSISPAGPISFCAGGAAQSLTATGGSGDFFIEKFNAFPISKFVVTGSGITEVQNTTYYQDAPSSVQLTYGNSISSASPAAYEMTNSIDMTQYSNAVLTFYHIAAFEATFDFGFVEYSTDGGTTWTAFPTSSYTGSGTLKNGVVSFDKTSYSDWASQLSTSGSNPGVPPATSMWKLETINLSPWQTSTQFKVRFRIQSDGSVIYPGWFIDNLKINSQATITWSPLTELYTDAAATTSYTGVNANLVYAKPTATRTYTATAAFGACPVTANVLINLTSNPISLTIAAAPSTTICGGDTVDFTIPTQNIQGSLNPLYDWKLNGTTITGSATGGSSVGTTVTVASTATLYPGMKVTVTAGTGAFAIDTRITSILSPTQFTISASPIAPLSGATVSATASGKTVTDIRYAGLSNGDVITCVLAVGGVTCVPVNPVTSNSITFTVNATTATSVSIAAAPGSTICAGSSVTFTATPTNGGAAPTYEWFINGVSQGAPSSSNTFTTAALTNGQVVSCRMASNASNCPFPKKPFSNNITMTVNPSFPVSVSITSSPAPSGSTVSICNGTSVTFTAAPTNGGGSPLFEWFINGISQGAPSGTNTFTTSTLADLDVVTCVLTSSISSCATGNPATSNTLNISVTTQVASVTITPATASCAGIARTFTATPTNGGATPTYQWYVNGSPVGTNSATYNYTPVNGDIIAVDMSSSLSCATPVPATASITQTVNANPTANIPGSPGTLCGSASVPFAISATIAAGSGTISTIQWRLGGSNIGGATAADYVTSVSGNYDVVVTNSNGCSVTSNLFVLNPAATTLMSGTYTIGAVTATGASSSGTTVTVASTANLVVGAVLSKISGTGTFAANTVITSIVNATTFTVNTAPTLALSGASIAGTTCTNYISFANAIADLNSRSINASCTFNVTPGYVENISAQLILGNATINAAVAGKTIVFQKSGVGANPIINAAFVGTANPNSPVLDGIWNLTGIDNVTIDGIDLNDNNTASALVCMEFGYGLFKLSATDGAQNNTIKNCTITLNKINNGAGSGVTASTPGSSGILVLNSIRTAATTALAAGGAVGANSNNKFYSNTIQNCNNGIALSGLAAVSPFTDGDTGNDIGGSSAATGNTIINFGGAAAAAQPASGVVVGSQWGVNISYNTINNNNGAGANHVTFLRGVYGLASTSASATISNNTITLSGAGTTTAVTAIENVIGTTAAGNTININNNVITGSYTTATTGAFTGILNSAVPANLNINGNTIQNITLAGTGSLLGISNTGAVTTALNINSNTITGNSKTGGVTATVALIGAGSPAATATTSINSNVITNNSIVGVATTPVLNCIQLAGTSTYTINNNTINNNSITGMTGTAVATLSGISNAGGTQNETVTGNTVSNLFITGTSTGAQVVRGIHHNTTGTSTRTVSQNTIFNIYTASGLTGTVTGINSQLGGTVTISKNTIYNLFPGQSATAGSIAKGIAISNGGGTGTSGLTVSNNMIAIDLTLAASATSSVAANSVLTNSDGIHGIEVTSALATSTYRLYYNSVRIAGNGAAGFGSSAVFHTISTTSTTATLDMRNNIFDNETTPNGGLAVAYRRSAGAASNLANYASTSNNNLFYAGTPGANNLIYSDGTSSAQTIAAYKAGVFTAGTISPRDQASVSDKPNFTSTTDLRLTLDNNCIMNGAGTPIAGQNDDIDAVSVRSATTPDIGADEFAGTNPVSLTVTNPATVCSGTPVDLTAGSVTTGSSGGTQFYYYTDAGGTTTLASPNNVLVAGTYYIKYGKGSCYSAVTPVVVTYTASGTWLGVDNNWNNASNWCGGIPTSATNVVIPGSVTNYPIITSGVTALSNNVTIAAGASVTTTGTGILDIKGSFTNNGTLSNWGEIRLTGTTAQTFPGATGTIDAMARLTINNTSGANPAVTLNRDLLIREAITPTAGIVNLNNIYVTLRSVVDSTARIGQVGGSLTYTGTGNFVVERYFPGKRTWRLITAPIVKSFARSVFNSWQAGGNTSINGNATYVTGPAPNLATNGLDASPLNNYSLKRFDYTTSGFPGIGNTRTATIPAMPAGASATYNVDTTGYFMFVRGDRTPSNPVPFDPTIIGNSTVLRDTGTVKTGAFTYNCNPGSGANIYTLVGNPYASAVDFTSLTRSNVANKFQAWDPTIGSVGAWAVWNAGVISPAGSVITSTIQSKQAFVVEATGASPTISFGEAAKSTYIGTSLLFRPAPLPAGSLNANLYFIKADGSEQLADGALVQFNDDYSAGSDHMDAVKFTNVNETFCVKDGPNYFIQDRRPFLHTSDTLFFSFTRARQLKYRFNISIDGIMRERNRVAYLNDKFLHTAVPLRMNGNTWIDFEVTSNAASAAADRFFITFKRMAKINNLKAEAVYSDANVSWSAEEVAVVDHFEVERSVDGTVFTKVGEVVVGENKTDLINYNFTDPALTAGYYYYRVKMVGSEYGVSDYTEAVRVKVIKSGNSLYVYPNPVTDGRIGLRVPFAFAEGKYALRLVDQSGKAVMITQLQHAKGVSTEFISYPSYLATGTYQLEVISPDKTKSVINIVIDKQ